MNTRNVSCARSYNFTVAASLLLFVVLWLICVELLGRMGRLPPVPLTATQCIDRKFKWLDKVGNLADVTVLGVGSSVTWRNLDMRRFREHFGEDAVPLNAAVCYLYANQTAFLTEFYVERMPRVDTVISVFAMRDFAQCTTEPTDFVDASALEAFLFEDGRPVNHLYITNFRAVPYVKAVIEPGNPGRQIDSYGFLPLDPFPYVMENVTQDTSCYLHLRRMTDMLAARGIRFIAVLMPPMPAWLEKFDPEGARDSAYRKAVVAHLNPQNSLLIDTADGLRLRNEDFTDPAHITATSIPVFVSYLLDELDRRRSMAQRNDLTGAASAL